MFTKRIMQITLVAVFGLSLSACTQGAGQSQQVPTQIPTVVATPTTAEPPQEPTPDMPSTKVGRANVESIEIVMRESFPVQISANIKGTVSDACTKAEPVTQQRDGNTFQISIGATREVGAMCAQVITPFETSVAIDAVGLKAGTYTVEANGTSTTFDLPVDNILK